MRKSSWTFPGKARATFVVSLLFWLAGDGSAHGEWEVVYEESFDHVSVGARTASEALSGWEGGAAAGRIFDGKTEMFGRFLVADTSWASFNQGPIFNLDLTAKPHDQVRVRFDLYTFGDWRGKQQATGGPVHRLMFFDSQASPRFSFDTSFSTNPAFKQSWPQRNDSVNEALRGAHECRIDKTGHFPKAYRWPVDFVYPSNSSSLRFTVLCGAAAGSGKPMPPFGIDNVEVSVHSTAPSIKLIDHGGQPGRESVSPTGHQSEITLSIPDSGRTSIGVFDKVSGNLVRTIWNGESASAVKRSVRWDGLDNRGRPVPRGEYEWRSITTPGFVARYITTIGINPPGGEHPQPRRSWVGDHLGAGIVDVDDSGVYVGSPMTEGLMMLLKIDDRTSKVTWRREQFYQGGRMTKAATSGRFVFMLHPNGKLRRLDKETGRVEAEWQLAADREAPVDIDARGLNLVAADPHQNKVRWLSVSTGREYASVSLSGVSAVAAIENREKGLVFASSGTHLHQLGPDGIKKTVDLGETVTSLDFDPDRRELWAVINQNKVCRLDTSLQVVQTYGGETREYGPYDPTRFAGIYDIAADLQGGFFVGEPSHPPRRIAHVHRDGSIIKEWYGGMSFYVGGTFDPDDPSRFFGIAPEGAVNVYRIDFETGNWKIEETYSTGRIGDSLFPNASAFRAVRRNGELFLYHRVIPAVLRLDQRQRRAIPVAIAGRVINQGRTFFQFAGSGRDGYPQPWVAAAEHHGYQDLKKAPVLYSWADSNGNGQFEPEEFRFYPHAKRGLSFHNPGDFTSGGDFLGATGTNTSQALVRLPVASWEGPDKTAPRWDWNEIEMNGEIIADSWGYGSVRGVSVGPENAVSVAYQAGIMIREHGQYEGGRWPEAGMRGSRLLSFNANLKPVFSVGRQSKIASEAGKGVLYYPMQTVSGPNRTVIVNDQTKQSAQVWTPDGLYVGGLLDGRVDDGLDDGFYQIHGDDNQGATVVTTRSGKHFWLSPYQGHNRLYEITGWDGWKRQSGKVNAPVITPLANSEGQGLKARYYQNGKVVFETIETPTYFQPFGAEPHTDKVTPFYKVVWTGDLHPPVTDRFQFQTLLGKSERVAIWIDGKLCHANGFGKADFDLAVDLSAGSPVRIRIEYINPDARAELKLLWRSRIVDPQPLPRNILFAAP